MTSAVAGSGREALARRIARCDGTAAVLRAIGVNFGSNLDDVARLYRTVRTIPFKACLHLQNPALGRLAQ